MSYTLVTNGPGDPSVALQVSGTILGIHMTVQIEKGPDSTALSGTCSLTENDLLRILSNLSSDWEKEFRESPLYPLVKDLKLETALIYDSRGDLAAVGHVTSSKESAALGILKNGGDLLLLLSFTDQSLNDALCANDSFTDFLAKVIEVAGAMNLCIGFKKGTAASFSDAGSRFSKIEKAVFDKSVFERVALPDRKELDNQTIIVSGKVVLESSSLEFLRSLGRIVPSGSAVSLTAGYGSPSFILIRITKGSETLEIMNDGLSFRHLDCYLKLGSPILIDVKGMLDFDINGQASTFIIDCKASSSSFGISAEYGGAPIPFGDLFSLSQIGLSIGEAKDLLTFGIWGIVQLQKIDLFALFFAQVGGGTVRILAMGLALNRLSISSLIQSLMRVTLPGSDYFDFIKLEPFPLESTVMETNVFSDLSREGLDKIAETFNKACSGKLGGRASSPVKGDSIIVRADGSNGWVLTDEINVRHYSITKSGKISLSPQFYYCTEANLSAGSYNLYKGMFVCASIEILKQRINIYGEVDDKNGFEALVMVAPIKNSWIKLTKSDKNYALMETGSNSIVEQYLHDGDGPIFYLCLKKNNYRMYLDASLEITFLSLKAATYLSFESGSFYLYAQIKFFLIEARLMLSASYSDFNNSSFFFKITLDFSFFQDIAQTVINMVRAFVAKTQARITDVQNKLAYAQQQVLGLQYQIDNVNRKIDSYSYELSHLKWYMFWKIPYYICVLGVLEVEKAGIYIAMGVAYAALEIAKLALEAVKQVTGAIGWLIEKLVEAVSSIFYLKEISITLDAKASQSMSAALSACFTLFGKDYTINTSASLSGNVSSGIHSSISNNVTSRTQSELNNMDKLDAVACIDTALKDYIEQSDFPYTDCDEYCQCISDGLEFVSKSATTYGALGAFYKYTYGKDDDLRESRTGQIVNRLSNARSQWMGNFEILLNVDCESLIQEVKKETQANGTQNDCSENVLGALEEKGKKFRNFQEYLLEQKDIISKMDENFQEATRSVQDSIFSSLPEQDCSNDSEDLGERYYESVFNICSDFALNDENAPDNSLDGFELDDKETYFINPANEPIINAMFLKVCENSESPRLQNMKSRVQENLESKQKLKNYRVRIPIVNE